VVSDWSSDGCSSDLSPWTYWGFRPPPRPANTVAWVGTDGIELALNDVLAKQTDREGRLRVLRRILREKVPVNGKTLGNWLKKEKIGRASCRERGENR